MRTSSSSRLLPIGFVFAFAAIGCGPFSDGTNDLASSGGTDGGTDASMVPSGSDLAGTTGADLAPPPEGAPDLAVPPTNLPDVTRWVDPFIGTASAGISGAVG